MSLRTAIVIPARYASVRLPGKPLVKIAGQTMLERVFHIACAAAEGLDNVSVTVATDDERVARHCAELGAAVVMTSPECPSGTDRAAAAVAQMKERPDFVLNLQGDAPLTPADFLRDMIHSFVAQPCDVITPVTQMTWSELDALRESKKVTPLSGTCAVFDEKSGRAFWFSKNIIPAVRDEERLRKSGALSPIYRHIGLYGYSAKMLNTYSTLPQGRFEKLEGLEQLRFIENGYTIRCIPVDYKGRPSMAGVDSPEDLALAEALIAKQAKAGLK